VLTITEPNGDHSQSETDDPLFAGPGEMRALCRSFDWSSTSLGPVEQWSSSLRTTVDIILACRNPMFLWWGPDLVQIYNDAYRPSLGNGERHPGALGAHGREFWTDIWNAIGPQIEQVMTTGEPTWHDDQYLPIERNGRLEDVWWTYSYSPVRDDDGKIGGTLVVCLETTQRVLGELERERLLRDVEVERSRFADVFHQAPTFLAVLRGEDHVFDLVNEAYYQLVGHRELVGLPLFDALPEIRGQGFEALLHRVLTTGEPFVGREQPLRVARTADSPPEDRYVDFVYLPLMAGDGTRVGVIAHGSDVTEQVRARHEVERLLHDSELARAEAEAARAEAETANRAKGEFLAVMSHELRTPLNAIGGYAELMELGLRGPVTEQQRGDLGRIQQSQKHLLGLINQVLNYTRIETGIVRYELEDVRVVDALATAEALVVPQVRAKGLTYVLGACDPALRASADPEKLQQILLNLLTNATKFTEIGGEIRVACVEKEGRVSITVSDTGIGIPPDKLATIFDPFVQVDQRLTRPHEGVGLWLAISRDLARGMGGDLAATSTFGMGSTFTVILASAPSGRRTTKSESPA
jgi:signal transduction histidine kinase